VTAHVPAVTGSVAGVPMIGLGVLTCYHLAVVKLTVVIRIKNATDSDVNQDESYDLQITYYKDKF